MYRAEWVKVSILLTMRRAVYRTSNQVPLYVHNHSFLSLVNKLW